MSVSNRIVFNTVITYGKAVLTIFISLFATRLVLNALGVRDFGLNNVVGGVVAMLSFLDAAMATSTQRFISISLGNGDVCMLKRVFANSVFLHFGIAFLLVFLLETFGLYFLNNNLKIDPERLYAANILFHFVVISTFVTIISVPYDAVINAHENMLFLAVIGIIESLLKLLIAFSLLAVIYDKLIIYGFLTMLLTIVVRIVKQLYVRKKYHESRVDFKEEFNLQILKELTTFTGWNLFGVLSYMGRNQGISIVLNLFFSTVVNAAYAIANQINGQLSFFSATITQVLQPQIMKSEGGGDRERLLKLSVFSSKFSFFLFAFFALPIYVELPLVLKIWLGNIPENTVIFCRLIILMTLVIQLRSGITIATHAIGKIKSYQLINSPVQLFTLPIGYLFFMYGFPPYSIILVALLTESIVLLISIRFFYNMTNYSSILFYKNVVFRCLSVLVITYSFLKFVSIYGNSYFFKLSTILISSLIFCFLVFFIGLDRNEKESVKEMFYYLKQKFIKKI
jgi:O-antigen/teichoic acid export membrane protein